MSLSVLVCAVLTITIASTRARSTLHDDPHYCSCTEETINRRGFPDGFVFGSASAAYQAEGAYNQSGKGMSMWDNFTHTYPERIIDGSNGDVAVDSYHLYKEDVKLLKNMGADAYKFSISWSRILPGGTITKGVSEDGMKYYNNLINELLANGIQPWVTLLHIDTSQALEDAYGGFLSPRIVKDFQDFADRVKHWITINEPWAISYLGYVIGCYAPGRCSKWISEACVEGDSATEPYYTTHNQLLAHAAIVKLYRDKYQEVQEGMIGVTVNSHWFLPYDDTPENLKARDRAFDFMLGWIMEPIAFGRYPESMRRRVGNRLPKFSQEEAEIVKGSFDFIGINYYSGKYALNIDDTQSSSSQITYITDSGYTQVGDKDGIPLGEKGSSQSYYNKYPMGLRLILRYLKLHYNDPLIYVTENGQNEDRDDSVSISEALKDYKRKQYFFDHLCCLQEAIQQDGVNMKGYFAWSLTDNYDWDAGYSVRFGLNYVDYGDESLTRYPKLSAQWLGSIFSPTPTRGLSDC